MTEASRSRRTLVLVDARALSPRVRSLELRTRDGSPVVYEAGQWVNLYPLHEGTPIRRSYSIARAPDPAVADRIEIAVTRVLGGPASEALHALPIGAEIEMDGPFGVFTRTEAQRAAPAIFVGTGTGVTPLRAMIQDEARRGGDGPPLVLLFGCRTEDDLLYRAEWEALAARWPRFRFIPTLSRPSESWTGLRGHVTVWYEPIAAELAGAHVYAAGLSRMVDEIRRISKERLGWDRKRIHTERYD
ncbi:MAG: FAD-dependent oxidoreductase [Myxococcota bacterium]|nr:FAD-dependent oxidoreductase [Myxococcota bacterium]MDW8362497.1 FAD-dependent oxidoreductase [Myxococcales bacterium]